MRVNDVIEIKIAGAIDNTVKSSRIFRAGTTCSGPCASAKLNVSCGMLGMVRISGRSALAQPIEPGHRFGVAPLGDRRDRVQRSLALLLARRREQLGAERAQLEILVLFGLLHGLLLHAVEQLAQAVVAGQA